MASLEVHPVVVLALQPRKDSCQPFHIWTHLLHSHHHASEHWRLGSIQVVYPPSVGDKAEALHIFNEVVNHPSSRIEHTRIDQATDDPVCVPIVCLPEPTARHNEAMSAGQERIALRIAENVWVLLSCERLPEVVEFKSPCALRFVSKRGQAAWRFDPIRRHPIAKFAAFLAEVSVDKVSECGSVCRLTQLLKCIEDVLGIAEQRPVYKSLRVRIESSLLNSPQKRTEAIDLACSCIRSFAVCGSRGEEGP
mmetsp:Transcript_14105/g.30633  ORF Transcript_14105/g.30633 Transcript_14105/m.30633 type:complete len:251 (+) Transcript_14105:1440-2192(+)